MAAVTGEAAWQANVRRYKTLALEHKLAAKRDGFFAAYHAMDLLDKDAAVPKPNGDRTGPAMVRPILGPMLDLVDCLNPDHSLNKFAAMDVLRRHGVLVRLPQTCAERQAALDQIQTAIVRFATVMFMGKATVREVLAPILKAELFEANPRLIQAYEDTSPPPPEPKGMGREAKEDGRKRGWHALFDAP